MREDIRYIPGTVTLPRVRRPGGVRSAAAAMHMSAEEVGDHLALLAWHSFLDFLVNSVTRSTPACQAEGLMTEEVLILFLWVHTRVCQNAFCGRADTQLQRSVLNRMHRVIFESLEARGMDHAELPLFEQRVGARYSEYNAVADRDASQFAAVAACRCNGGDEVQPSLRQYLAEAASAAAGPLGDYLSDIELTG